jgi:hypothetical protein
MAMHLALVPINPVQRVLFPLVLFHVALLSEDDKICFRNLLDAEGYKRRKGRIPRIRLHCQFDSSFWLVHNLGSAFSLLPATTGYDFSTFHVSVEILLKTYDDSYMPDLQTRRIVPVTLTSIGKGKGRLRVFSAIGCLVLIFIQETELCLTKDIIYQNMNMFVMFGLLMTDWSSRFKQPVMTSHKICYTGWTCRNDAIYIFVFAPDRRICAAPSTQLVPATIRFYPGGLW